ncbi:hypothetical protein GN956_G14020 [Arapaima gigas]
MFRSAAKLRVSTPLLSRCCNFLCNAPRSARALRTRMLITPEETRLPFPAILWYQQAGGSPQACRIGGESC